MSAEPLISIALCTYNGARFLRPQMDSLLAQTHRTLEVIAVDDASTDETRTILEGYAREDSRIRVVVNDRNLGFRGNFEKALSLCRGEYIAPCDQDDIWLPGKLHALLDAIGDRALCYCDSEIVDENGASIDAAMSTSLNMISTEDPMQFAAANCVAGHALLIRREVAQCALPVPEGFYYDWWLAAFAAAHGGVVYCDRKLVRYRLHGANVTNHLRDRTQKAAGRRETRLIEFRMRLEALARLPGPSRALLVQMHELWFARERQWVSLRLAAFMYRHWRRLHSISKSRARLLPALRFGMGLRLKRATNPAAYRTD